MYKDALFSNSTFILIGILEEYILASFRAASLMKVFLITMNMNHFLYFVKLRAISKYKPPGAYIWRGDMNGGFFALLV